MVHPLLNIAVVEDHDALREIMVEVLRREGHHVQGLDCAEALDDSLIRSHIDLLISDLNLPGADGYSLTKRFRAAHPLAGIIMVTARTEDQDAVRALDIGADDYIAKPFAMEHVIARIRALLRRSGRVASKGSLAYADLAMDQDAHRVTRAGRPLHLGPTEYRLLEFFLQHPGRVFAREQLLDAVWGRDIHVEPRTVDVHIRRLRKAINQGDEVDLIRTVRSAGYALDSDPDRLG